MYSIVMLASMSAGADVTPAPAPATLVPGGVFVAGAGCCGGAPVGCYGSCAGYAYGSCHGGGHGRLMRGGFLGGRGACHGGGYSCSGFNCFASGYACYGSGYGSYVGSYIAGYGSCHGCHGAFSYGSSWGPAVGMPPYTLHGYNSGYYADPHAVWGTTPGVNRPPAMTVPVAPAPMTKPSSDKEPQGANLKFNLPGDAKLFVDGRPTAGTGAERTFYTPPLAAGQKFFYDVKAELTVGGETVVEEKRVVVAAGKPTTVAGK